MTISEASITVKIPTPLRTFTQGRDVVVVGGSTVRATLDELERSHPGIRERICEPDGGIRQYVRVFLNDEDVRYLQGVATPVKRGDTLTILPAIAGGR
jgi:molybdopterin synthase sulfur carrier subunit